jgi:tape measure domain-containing protein
MADDIEVLITELRVDMKRYESAMRRQARLTEQTAGQVEKRYSQMNRRISQSTSQMSRDVRRAIVAIALGAGAREVTQYADAWVDLNNKLASSSQISGIQAKSLNEIQDAARESRAEISSYVDLYSRMLRVSGKMAASEEDVARATQIVTRSFKAGGAAASEQSSGVMQLGQALNGLLGGDELKSVRENAPLLFEGIAKGLGVTSDKLKGMGAAGELTGKKVFEAILKSGADIDAAFAVTIPRASDATVLAFDRLKVKVGEYLNEGGQVAGISKTMGDAINVAADNVDMLADAFIIAGAAVTGALGAQAAVTVIASLNGIAVGATATARAMSILRAASAFMFGPVGLIIGVAAAAGALAYMAIQAGKTETPLERTRSKLAAIGEEMDAIDALLPAPFGAIKDGAVDVLDALDPIPEKYRKIREEMEATGKAARQGAIDVATVRIIELNAELSKSADKMEELAALANSPVKAFGGAENAARANGRIAEEIELTKELQAALARATEQRGRLLEAPDSAFKPKSTSTGGGGGGGGEADKDALKAIDDLKSAYRGQFESQREQIARVLEEQLAAIDKAGGAEATKAALRTKANDLYLSQLADIREADDKDFDAFVDREVEKSKIKADQAKSEQDIISDLMDRRDELAGFTIGIIEREYEARRTAIEEEIKDAGRKAEAIALLEAEQAATVADIRAQLLGEGEYSDSEADRVRAAGEAKLEALKEGLEEEAITREEYAIRKLELEQATEDQLAEIRATSMQMQLAAGEQLFGGLAGLAKTFAGEQSGIYKVLFAIEKAAAIASAIIAIQTGVARALSLPFPANIAAGAAVAAQGAGVVATIASTAANFADGGVDIRGPGTGRSDSIAANLSRGESVITASGTAANRGILAAINAGANVENMIGASRGISSVSIGSTQLVVQGDIGTAETLAALQESLNRRDADIEETVISAVRRNRVQTVARHRR